MPAVNWDQPSNGSVSDPSPSLALKNDQGGALRATSENVAVDAESKNNLALRARTSKTLTASVESDQFVALLARAPKSVAAIAGNEAGTIALAGVNLPDPAIPNPANNPNGIGVAGLTGRFGATGVAGVALGPRSVGVRGEAQSGVGVRGIGSNGGVEGQSSGSNGVSGTTGGASAAGVSGFAAGVQAAGVRGLSTAGAGVEASSNAGPGVRASSQQAEGVVAEAKAANAAGVRARNDHAAGVGVDGSSQSGIALRGLSTKGTAVYADTWSGRAVDASNLSQTEPAIFALGPITPGVEAGSFGAPGVKAFGKTGVHGASIVGPDANAPEVGAGVYGGSLAAAGVCGLSVTGTGVVGIGHVQFGGWAGHFSGNVFIDGVLFKQISLFSIDHPLDPENKVLNHAAVEAPEHKTFYDGVARLDGRGRAKVKLPRWFAALNDVRTLCYQLTPIGGPASELHVAQEFKDGGFAIAGGRPRQKVCWQVAGVRRDRAAKANPVVVEQKKTDARPGAVNLTPADLKRRATELRKSGEALKREGAKRERLIKSRRFADPLPTPPRHAEPDNDATAKLVAQTLELTRRLSKTE